MSETPKPLELRVPVYSRWMDKKGKLLIVLAVWKTQDEKTGEFTVPNAITFLDYEREERLDEMPWDRFVNQVASFELKRHVPASGKLPF